MKNYCKNCKDFKAIGKNVPFCEQENEKVHNDMSRYICSFSEFTLNITNDFKKRFEKLSEKNKNKIDKIFNDLGMP